MITFPMALKPFLYTRETGSISRQRSGNKGQILLTREGEPTVRVHQLWIEKVDKEDCAHGIATFSWQ
jgi:hypothetical protein